MEYRAAYSALAQPPLFPGADGQRDTPGRVPHKLYDALGGCACSFPWNLGPEGNISPYCKAPQTAVLRCITFLEWTRILVRALGRDTRKPDGTQGSSCLDSFAVARSFRR